MRLLCILFFAGFAWCCAAQPSQEHMLATEYYRNGEYEKAAGLFEKLHNENPASSYYYKYLLNCRLVLEEYKEAFRLVKDQRKTDKDNLTLYVDMGYVYQLQGDNKKAQEEYDQAIENLTGNRVQITQLAASFQALRQFDYAVRVYKEGARKVQDKYPFTFELGNLYRAMDKRDEMISHYLDHIEYDPGQTASIQYILQDELTQEEDRQELKRQLYARVQKNSEDIIMTEMLIWVMLQDKDFTAALRQVKALDKRLNENGRRVFDLAQSAMQEEDFDAAIDAFTYLKSKGREAPYYLYASQGMLKAQKEKITHQFSYSRDDLVLLEKDYLEFIEEHGGNRVLTASAYRELANLYAFFLHDTQKAIAILEDLIAVSGMNYEEVAEIKLDLGDLYLLEGDIWEATLIYSQVDKKMKDDPLGEAARFRNAKLSYYRGDFEWAQAQLDILKGSTSELIANDALDLSVFITDHLGLDTTEIPMQLFARADLLRFQNKDAIALKTLDTLLVQFPGHDLSDDVYMAKAHMALKTGDTKKALEEVQKVIDHYPYGILMDDALYLSGQIYEELLEDYSSAMNYYERLMKEQKGSVFVIDARERFRKLRGDNLN